jgi:hypothetical protein
MANGFRLQAVESQQVSGKAWNSSGTCLTFGRGVFHPAGTGSTGERSDAGGKVNRIHLPAVKKEDKVYRKRAAELRKYGFAVRLNKRIKPQQKTRITKLWKQKKFYITNQDRNRIEFVRVRSKSSLKTARSVLSGSQITPSGFFLQRPKGIKRGSLKYTLRRGELEITARKRMHDIVIPISVRHILRDPIQAQQRALSGRKKPRKIRLMVNGFAGKTSYPVADFFNYMKEELIPYLRGDADLRGKMVNQRMTNGMIEDAFHLRLIY